MTYNITVSKKDVIVFGKHHVCTIHTYICTYNMYYTETPAEV